MITHPLTFARTASQSRQKGILTLCLPSLFTLDLSLSASAQKATYITFVVSGTTRAIPTSINPEGMIAGYYFDTCCTYHSFVRTRDGTIATLDPPGADFTQPNSINAGGQSPDITVTRAVCCTASSGLATAPSPPSIPWAVSSPCPRASTPHGQLRGNTRMRVLPCMASCGHPTEPSPRSILQARLKPCPQGSTPRG